MKKILFVGLIASVLAIGICFTPSLKVEAVTLDMTIQGDKLTKSDFMAYIDQSIKVDYLHNADSVEDWIVKDEDYLSYNQDHKLLQEQTEELLKLIEDMRKDYVTVNEAKVYGFKQVAYIDALVSAVNHRQGIISGTLVNKDKTLSAGGKEYQIISKTLNGANVMDTLLSQWRFGKDTQVMPSEKDLLLVAEGVWEALTEYNVPNKTLDNLPIFISPYYLSGYLGFTSGYNLIGRDEEVVIAASAVYENKKQTAINTTLHELGHVFMSDIIGKVGGDYDPKLIQDKNNWNKLYINYPETHDLSLDERTYMIEESFAEHFRSYFQEKANQADYTFSPIQTVYTFIEEQLKIYDPNTNYAVPTLVLQGITVPNIEFNYGAALRFRTNTMTATLSEWDLSQKPLMYTFLKKDEARNSAITLAEDIPIVSFQLEFKVEPGQYALLIYSSDGLLRFNEFGVE